MFNVDPANITNITSLERFFGSALSSYVLLISVNIVIIIIASCGNTVVLYASTLYHAIKMDRTSLIFLENLAVADILLAVIFYGPITLTLVSRRWVLGSWLCGFNAFFTSTPSIAEILILTAISLHRIWLIKNPFAVEVRPVVVKCVIVGIWILSLVPAVVWFATDMFAYYDPLSLSCISSAYTDNSMTHLVLVSGLLLIVIPMLVVILCNVYLLFKAISTNRRVGRQSVSAVAVVTITIICWTFIISWVPFLVKLGLQTLKMDVPAWLYVVQIEMLSLNVTLNPLIYTATNRRFRNFVIRRLLRRKKGGKIPKIQAGNVREVKATQKDSFLSSSEMKSFS